MDENTLCTSSEDDHFHDVIPLSRRLDIIEAHIGKPVWLAAHLDCVHKTLRSALEVDPLVHRAISIFIRMVGDFILTNDYAEPLERTFQALLRAMELKDPNLLAELFGALAELNPLNGKVRKGLSSAKMAIAYVEDGANDPDAILHAYVRILHALSYTRYKDVTDTQIDEILRLAIVSRDQLLVTEVHLAVAHLYVCQEKLKEAFEQANFAYTLADQKHHITFKIRALRMLAIASRLMWDLDAAEAYLETAMTLHDGIDEDRRRGSMLLELAGLRYEQKRHEESERTYLEAKALFEKTNMNHLLALTKHGLGILWVAMERYDEARDALLEAVDEYRWSGNQYGVADMYGAIGRLEARAGNVKLARKFLRAAEGIGRRLEESPARDELVKYIQQWRKRVEDGEFGDIK